MEAKGRRIFVAGATGYLGRFVVREALARGHAVRALTRDGARLPPELAEIPRAEGAAFEVEEGEATRPETLRGLTRDCDVLFSSIGITRQRDKGVKYADVDYGANRDRSGVVIAERNQFSNRMAIIFKFHFPGHKIGNVNVATMKFPDMKIIPIS